MVEPLSPSPVVDLEEKYSSENFETLLAQLSATSASEQSPDPVQIVELLKTLAAFLSFSAKHKLDYFDLVIQDDILLLCFPKLLGFGRDDITVQIMATVSILVQNMKDISDLTILCSGQLLRQIIACEFQFSHKSFEVVDQYVNLLKALSLRLSQPGAGQLLELFKNMKIHLYAMFNQACQFANHPNLLIRTSVRTVILTLLSLEEEPQPEESDQPQPQQQQALIDYMPQAHYLILNLAFQIRDTWLRIDKEFLKGPDSKVPVIELQQEIDDAKDLMNYVQDLYDTVPQNSQLKEMLTRALIRVFYAPVVVQSLCVLEIAKPKMSIQVCLFVLTCSLALIKEQTLIEEIIGLMFKSHLEKELSDCLKQKDLVQCRLYSEAFKVTPVNQLTTLEIFAAFAYDRASFEAFIAMAGPQWIREEMSLAEAKDDRIEYLFQTMGESDQIAVKEDQKLIYELLGVKGLFVDAQIQQYDQSEQKDQAPLIPSNPITASSSQAESQQQPSEQNSPSKIDQEKKEENLQKKESEQIANQNKTTLLMYIKSKDDALLLQMGSLFYQLYKLKKILPESLQSEMYELFVENPDLSEQQKAMQMQTNGIYCQKDIVDQSIIVLATLPPYRDYTNRLYEALITKIKPFSELLPVQRYKIFEAFGTTVQLLQEQIKQNALKNNGNIKLLYDRFLQEAQAYKHLREFEVDKLMLNPSVLVQDPLSSPQSLLMAAKEKEEVVQGGIKGFFKLGKSQAQQDQEKNKLALDQLNDLVRKFMHMRILLNCEVDLKELLDDSMLSKMQLNQKMQLPDTCRYFGLLFTYATAHPKAGFGKLTALVDQFRFTEPENLLLMDDPVWFALFKPNYFHTKEIAGELWFKIRYDVIQDVTVDKYDKRKVTLHVEQVNEQTLVKEKIRYCLQFDTPDEGKEKMELFKCRITDEINAYTPRLVSFIQSHLKLKV